MIMITNGRYGLLFPFTWNAQAMLMMRSGVLSELFDSSGTSTNHAGWPHLQCP